MTRDGKADHAVEGLMSDNPLSSRFEEALTFAARLHARQTRKGSNTPYVAHLLSVAAIALQFGAPDFRRWQTG